MTWRNPSKEMPAPFQWVLVVWDGDVVDPRAKIEMAFYEVTTDTSGWKIKGVRGYYAQPESIRCWQPLPEVPILTPNKTESMPTTNTVLASYDTVSARKEILSEYGGDEELARIYWCNRLADALEVDFLGLSDSRLGRDIQTDLHEHMAFQLAHYAKMLSSSFAVDCESVQRLAIEAYTWAMGHEPTGL